MGPFPHDSPPPVISDENPMGTDGFEFVEFCHPRPDELDRLFRAMGFAAVAQHRSKNVTLYRQGDINFVLNVEPGSFAANLPRSTVLQHQRWHFVSLMRSRPSIARSRAEPSRQNSHWSE